MVRRMNKSDSLFHCMSVCLLSLRKVEIMEKMKVRYLIHVGLLFRVRVIFVGFELRMTDASLALRKSDTALSLSSHLMSTSSKLA